MERECDPFRVTFMSARRPRLARPAAAAPRAAASLCKCYCVY